MSEAFRRSSASGNDLRLQGAKARAHRDNHYLPLRKAAPTPAEIAATEQALQVLFRSLQASACETQLLRAGLTVRLMLDLGRSEEHLHRLCRIHVDGGDPAPPKERGLVSWEAGDKLSYGWWLPAGVHIDKNGADHADLIRGDVWLPLLERTALWLNAAGLIDDRQPRPLLNGSPEELQSDVVVFRDWVQDTLGSLGRAVPKAGKLMKAVTEQLAWHPTGDRTLAMQLTGRDLEHSNARSYYTSVSVPKAAKHYAMAMRSPISNHSLAISAEDKCATAMPAFAQSALTRKEPRGSLETIRLALSLVDQRPDNRKADKGLVNAHNEFVLKLWIALALCTAGRSFNEWVPGLQLIEPRTGALMVLDKNKADDQDEGEPSSARLVFIHSSVREMLQHYNDHLRKLLARPTLDEKSRVLIKRHLTGLQGRGLQPFLELQLESDKLVAKAVEPKWIVEVLAGLANVPSNFARHCLRSGLVSDIPQSGLDALLGHFDQGTEPWTNGSALDPAAYRALVNVIFDAYFAEEAKFKDRSRRPRKKKCNDGPS